jgi:hypothetical protein
MCVRLRWKAAAECEISGTLKINAIFLRGLTKQRVQLIASHFQGWRIWFYSERTNHISLYALPFRKIVGPHWLLPAFNQDPWGTDRSLTQIVLHLVVTFRMQTNFMEQRLPSQAKREDSKIPTLTHDFIRWCSATEVFQPEFTSAKEYQIVTATVVCLKTNLDNIKNTAYVRKMNYSSLLHSCFTLSLE